MSYSDVPQALPQPNNRKVIKIVLALVGAFVLLSGGCIALIVKAGTASYGAAKIGADWYLTFLEKRDFAGARDQMTDAGSSATTEATIEDTIAVAEKRRGKMTRHEGPIDWRENSFNGVTTVQLAYKEIFAHGETTINLTMLSENGAWKVQNFQINF